MATVVQCELTISEYLNVKEACKPGEGLRNLPGCFPLSSVMKCFNQNSRKTVTPPTRVIKDTAVSSSH
ncbi:hypothetical protein AAMO2058_001001100 [Amorphochlora amoebiformis]